MATVKAAPTSIPDPRPNEIPDFAPDPGPDLIVESRPGADNSIPQLIDRLRTAHRDRITGELVEPAQPGRFSDFPEDLSPALIEALRARGISRLFSHQRRAWDLVRAGSHTVLVTPTASGKTLCYNLPVLHAATCDKAKALYLFPTKALSQDQVAEISQLNQAGGLEVRACTFDGDTPGDARKAVRTQGDVVVTNPDMLHQAILPHHTKWAQFFESLRFVVIDEMHTYRGVFGSHMANVIRRLWRVARFYGACPVFITCSATIANPGELASRLIGAPVELIDESGAPRGRRTLLLWNPPIVNRELGLRASARSQTVGLARAVVRAGLKGIVFARTRVMVEVLTKYLKDVFDHDPRRPARITAYRGGYLPAERRSTESLLRDGRVDCVVATSALELGVDIGSLDVCLLNGYPGTVAGTWQRLGRAGRRRRPSLGVLVASSLPLDQYIVRNPEFFLGASPEQARIDPDQLLILLDHVRCAAFELPFSNDEPFGDVGIAELLDYLVEEEVLHHEDGRWHWMTDSYPANSVSLRTVSEGNFLVVDATDGAKSVIAEVDYVGAPMTLYEGAIYMMQSRPWQVEQLDWEGRKAYVRRTEADYFTEAIDYTRLNVLEALERHGSINAQCVRGEVHLVRRVAGYKKIKYYSHESVGYGHVNLPDHEMHTTAVWWRLGPRGLTGAFESRWRALDGFLGASYSMHHVASLLTMSETADLGRAVGNSDATWFTTIDRQGRGHPQSPEGDAVDVEVPARHFEPTLFLYDNYPGGIGLSAPIFERRTEIVERAIAMIASCDCEIGCPSCIGPVVGSDDGWGRRGAKEAALEVLSRLAGCGDAAGRP